MSIKIETFNDADRDDWLALWQAYLVFYKATLPEDVGHTTWKRMLDPQGDIEGFKAIDEDGKMVGMVTYLYHGTTWSDKPRCYLHDLFTLPETRGKGVGRTLINAVYDAARADGAEAVYWLTQEFNYPGRILYDKVADRTPFIKYSHTL
ncbi:MAG: GNAT family N-acetyltransferase [Rhizobiaceae bacterium]